MPRPIDAILSAAQDKVKSSGLIEQSIRMGVVSAVATDGTITVTAAGSTFPKVRLLQSVGRPAVGDSVEIANTLGGWVCLGVLATATDTDWVTPTLVSGYTKHSSKGVAKYRLITIAGTRFVQWQGSLNWTTNGSPPNSAQFYTMPSGIRPPVERSVAAAAGGLCVKIDFRPAGECVIVFPTGLTTWAALDGIQYTID